MTKNLEPGLLIRRVLIASLAFGELRFCECSAPANPTGGVVTQGDATFSTSGSHLTVTTSGNTGINWQSFNIGAGETTTFVEPTSTSVVWNQINSGSPSQILGTLNANGYVVLQNTSGFYIGGNAVLSTHGLVMTTSRVQMPDLSTGGTWQFDAPPPTASIINYGQINVTGGGPAFLLADNIENNGTISAPGGNIGLYAGEQVLVSMAPDGRGLSAEVTLPQGSVDNEGKLIADGGTIAAQAQTVNQNGLVQANSVQDVNGTIELLASDTVNLGANSTISAQGDSQGTSAGGKVTIQGGNTFSDQAGSSIDIAGGAQGGNGGQVEISAPQMSGINSTINGQAANGFVDGTLFIDPENILLTSPGNTAPANGTVNSGDAPVNGTLVIDPSTFASTLSAINLSASQNIEVAVGWSLADQSTPATLNLSAGNNITVDDGAYIAAGKDWTINLNAGTAYTGSTSPGSGNDGVYLNGSAYLQTENGNINVTAANEVILGTVDSGVVTPGTGAIRTLGGGNIDVTTTFGDVNAGAGVGGYTFAPHASVTKNTPPYYTVNAANLSGISTAAGGNVDITAGGNVISYLPVQNDYADAVQDPGSGAFGPEAGNVTITAGGNVYGNYVVANGIGSITAKNGNIGVSATDPNADVDSFALSLINGSWTVAAPNGNIYVQDILNPNGIYDDTSTRGFSGYHNFDYGAGDSVTLDAGGSIELTGYEAPQSPPSAGGTDLPIILPPQLTVISGGDFTLDTSAILFPSPDQALNLTIGGDFIGVPNGNPIDLEMSDSAATSWTGPNSFGTGDHAATPPEINNPNMVSINVAGNMEDINLYTTMATAINVGGNIENSGFVGENLHSTDVSSIYAGGSIINSPLYSFIQLSAPITSANPAQPGTWDSVFDLAVTPAMAAALENLNAQLALSDPNGEAYYLKENGYLLFPSSAGSSATYGSNPGFVYDPTSSQLGFKGNMTTSLTAAQISALESGQFMVLEANSQGIPIVEDNHFVLIPYTFSASSVIASLNTESANDSTTAQLGFQIGGPGQFDVTAGGSINLGNSPGIQSLGFGQDYASLESVCGTLNSGGAAVSVTTGGDLDMVTASIDSLDGGNVDVNVGGALNLSEGNFNFLTDACYGIYTSGHSDVNVVANGDINVGSARIATFNGGNVFVESQNGDVNAGNGANNALLVYGFYIDPTTKLPAYVEFGDLTDITSLQENPAPYGSGILAEAPTSKYLTPGGNQTTTTQPQPLPGNITIETPHGNIISGIGGISQFALDGNIKGGNLTVSLNAGASGVPATPDQGNINVDDVIGVNISVKATGNVNGNLIAQHTANINAGESIAGAIIGPVVSLIGGAPSTGPLVVVGTESISATGLGSGANLLSQNVSANGGSSQSTLGSSASATATSQAAAQQSAQAQQQVATTDTTGSDGDNKKKQAATLHTKRVTVILPAPPKAAEKQASAENYRQNKQMLLADQSES